MRSATISLCIVIALGAAAGCKSKETPVEVVHSTPVPTSAATAAAVAAAPPAATPGSSWLDPPFTNWNGANPEIPKAPGVTVDDATKERCKLQNRPPACAEDRALVDAGWTLFGPLQTFGKATMISAMATVDVGCRPMAMQTFVFVDGKLAGTLSPKPMDSLTDGAQRYAFLTGDDFLFAEFARYAPQDQRCCPSRFATVTYKIKTDEDGTRLVPLEVNHAEAPAQKR